MSKVHRREPVEIEDRKSLTEKQRAELFLAHGGICHICKLKIKSNEPWDDEHAIGLWFGGSNALRNRAPAHRLTCHAEKSAAEATIRAKIKRQRIKHGLDPRKAKKPRPIPTRNLTGGGKLESRGFDKSRTRKFSGEVVVR